MILLYSQGTFPLYEIIKCSARKLQGFSTNAELTLYYHSANIDYIGQKGTLADVSTSKSFLSATSTVQQIEQADGTVKDGSDKYLVMSNAAYAPMQAYLDISFTDNVGTALAITQHGLTPVPTSPVSRTIRISWHKMSVRGRFSAQKYGKLTKNPRHHCMAWILCVMYQVCLVPGSDLWLRNPTDLL